LNDFPEQGVHAGSLPEVAEEVCRLAASIRGEHSPEISILGIQDAIDNARESRRAKYT
jgi:hypothetical protein